MKKSVNLLSRGIPVLAALTFAGGCASSLDGTSSGEAYDPNKLVMTYVDPGQAAPVTARSNEQEAIFDAVPKLDGSNINGTIPKTIILGLNKVVRFELGFESGKNGDTPERACVGLQLPEGTEALGALASGDYTSDFVYFPAGKDTSQEAMICFDPSSHANTIALAALSTHPKR